MRKPELLETSGQLFFTSFFDGRWELYRSDGTAEDTVLVSTDVSEFSVTTRALYYVMSAESEQRLFVLRHNDATSQPVPIRIDHQRIGNLQTVSDRTLYFVDDVNNRSTPWISDGTEQGTFPLSVTHNRSFRQISGTIVDDAYIYTIPVHGVFRTDGTDEGTFQIAESGWPFAAYFGMGSEWAYFISYESNQFTLTATDGTSVAETYNRSFTAPILIDGQIRLSRMEGPLPHAYSVIDDQLGVTHFQIPTSVNIRAAPVGDYWYYTGEQWEPPSGEPEIYYRRLELGKSDSAIAMETFGGEMLIDNTSTLVAGTRTMKYPNDPLFTVAAGRLSVLDGGLVIRQILQTHDMGKWHYGDDGFYFISTSEEYGQEVWRSDGIAEGTSVIDLFPGASSSNPELINWGGASLVVANTPGTGRELWRVGEQPPGDTNGDFSIDFEDFLVVSQRFGQEANGPSQGDFDGDGVVSFSDFLILADRFRPKPL